MNGTLDQKKVKGKILVCLRGQNGRTEKGQIASLAGAVGMILVNDQQSGDELIADPHVLPATHLTYTDGKRVFDYLNSTKYFFRPFCFAFEPLKFLAHMICILQDPFGSHYSCQDLKRNKASSIYGCILISGT